MAKRAKTSGDIIDFAEAFLNGSSSPQTMIPAYIETKAKVEATGASMQDYIGVCLRKRGIEIDDDVLCEIFILGGIDAVTDMAKGK